MLDAISEQIAQRTAQIVIAPERQRAAKYFLPWKPCKSRSVMNDRVLRGGEKRYYLIGPSPRGCRSLAAADSHP